MHVYSCTIILALTYFTGHPQEWFLLVLALSAWCLSTAWNSWRFRGVRSSVVQIGWWAVTMALSIGIAAVEIAPELAIRPWLARNSATPIGVGIPRRYRLGARNLWQLLSPTALGGPSDYFGDDNYWETLFSIGLAPLFLAVIGAARHPDRKRIRGWLLLLGLAIWFACGRHLVLYALAYLTVPGVAGSACQRGLSSSPISLQRSWQAWGSKRFEFARVNFRSGTSSLSDS